MVEGTNKGRFTGQQPGTKKAFRPAAQQMVNRWSTAGQLLNLFFRHFLIQIRLFASPKKTFERVFSIRRMARARDVSYRIDLTASRPIQPRAALLPRHAPPRPYPTVVCPGFGFDMSNNISPNLSLIGLLTVHAVGSVVCSPGRTSCRSTALPECGICSIQEVFS